MAMSTQTLDESARLLSAAVLLDRIQVLSVGDPVTVGTEVTRALDEVGAPIAGLVQTISLESAVDGRVTQVFSIKVPRGTALNPGQAIRVEACLMEPALVGKVILVDTMSKNGLAMLRKGYGSTFENVNQEGKEGLA